MTTEQWQLAFVDSISAAPTVRLNLCSGAATDPWELLEGTRFDPPPLRRSIPQSLLADGGAPANAVYDNRTVLLKLRLQSYADRMDPEDAAVLLQPLIRELDRPSNILKLQAGTSAPVFFRTYRSGPEVIDFDPVSREATVSVLAEPFAVGLEETLAAVTVYNDPAEGVTLNTNPFFEVDVSGWSANAGEGTIVRSTAQFHEGAASLLLTPDGVGSQAAARSVAAAGVAPGEVLRASAWLRCAVARSVTLRIGWRDSGGVFLSQTPVSAAVAANTWTFFEVSGAAPALTGQAGVDAVMTGTPAGSNTLHVDEARLRRLGGAGGMCFDVGSPSGDVETPLFLTVSSGVVGTGRRRSAISVRRRGTASATPLFVQAESMTLASNVSLPGADTTMSGLDANYARISYSGTSALIQRLSTATRFPSTASVDARGTYRVFARVRQNTGADIHTMRLRWGGADVQVTNDLVTLPVDAGPGAPTRKLIDLGVVQIPAGYDPVERGMSGVELACEGVFLAVDTGRTSGSGTLDVDYLVLLPVDDRAMFVDWPANASVTDFVVEGGSSPSVYARNASGQITSTQAAAIAGTGLMITPGITNRVFFHRDVGTGTAATGAGDSVTATTTVTPSYYPRYIGGFRPATT